MEPRQTRTRVAVGVLVLAGLLGFCLYAIAGDLEPNAPPAPTMHTLDEIYDAVEATQGSVIDEGSGVSQREGHVNYFSYGIGDTDILTVPAGKRFVLLKVMHYAHDDFYLRVNGTTLLTGKFHTMANATSWDFPDRCLILEAGDTMQVHNHHGSVSIQITIIGYFYDVP